MIGVSYDGGVADKRVVKNAPQPYNILQFTSILQFYNF